MRERLRRRAAMLNIDERLTGWGLVWRARLSRTGLVGAGVWSTKRGYGNAYHWDASTSVSARGVHLGSAPSVRMETDAADAMRIERAVCSIDIYHHVVLKGHYVRMWSPGKTIREARAAAGDDALRRKRFDYLASLAMARALVSVAVELPAVVLRRRAVAIACAALMLPQWDEAYVDAA